MTALERIDVAGAGVTLAGDAAGPADGPLLLFLHGSGQTRGSWGKALEQAARRGYRAITLDLRGHGDSDWSPDGDYALDRFAADLRAVLAALPRPPILIGASLGGMIGMLVAAERPAALAGLVLVDISARIEMDAAREVADFMASGRQGFASPEEAADAVAAYLPHRERPRDTSGLRRNLRERGGRWYWHWDPAFMRLGEDAGTRRRAPAMLEEAARRLSLPVLLIRGGRSRIVTEEGARAFLAAVPHADYVDIAGADHMVAGDANDAFNAAVFAFADRHRAAAAAAQGV